MEGVIGADVVSMTNTGAGTFDTKNVGTGKLVTTNIGLAGADAFNYTLSQPQNVRASIAARALTVAATGVNKVYDGTTVSGATLSGNVASVGDDVRYAATSNNFDTKNVGTGKLVSVGGISISGTDARNYSLANTSATTVADITPYIISLTGSRVYDATSAVAASVFGVNGVVNGVAGESLTLNGSGATSTKNVGSYVFLENGTGTFNQGSLGLIGNGGALASNYTLAGGRDSVTITPARLTIVANASDKTYDATRSATAFLSTQPLSADVVSAGFTGALFGDKNVGQGKSVSITGITLFRRRCTELHGGYEHEHHRIHQPQNHQWQHYRGRSCLRHHHQRGDPGHAERRHHRRPAFLCIDHRRLRIEGCRRQTSASTSVAF